MNMMLHIVKWTFLVVQQLVNYSYRICDMF